MLFVAINISESMIQQRIMQQGMTLFIDVKGKKKENRGVQYPLGTESGTNMQAMKVFGFDNSDPSPQSLKTEGTINIAIGWDSALVMILEYNIPLKMLEGSLDQLNNKKISVGWKINEAYSNAAQPATTTSQLVAVPSSAGRPPANRNVGLTQTNPVRQPEPPKAQSIWTTHTITF
jgi:hypothetical protein